MKTDYSQTSLLDMVFENRNKAYGAYVLRRDHDKSLKTAMLFTFSSVFILLSSHFIAEKIFASAKDHPICDPIIDVSLVQVPPKAPVEVPKPPVNTPPKPKPTVQNEDYRIVQKDKASDSIPEAKDLKDIESGAATNGAIADNGIGIEGGKGNGSSFDLPVQPSAPVEEVVNIAEVMPEFPGGEKKLLKFLADNTRFPDYERENGIGGKVLAQVIIGKDGRICDVQIVKSPSPGFDREVTRVVKMIPAFKPGLQQGRPVKVKMVVPFKFDVPN